MTSRIGQETAPGAWSPYAAIIDLALAEDIGTGDVTTLATVPPETSARATMLAKAPGVLSGVGIAADVFRRVEPSVRFAARLTDGTPVETGAVIAEIEGPAQGILMAERTALNFIQHLSGIATLTREYVAAVADTSAVIVDTRKTLPGLRALAKAAVRHGGGQNHRFGLHDGILIKDNHLAATEGPERITRAIQAARRSAPHTLRIEVEVTTLDEVREALTGGADIIMLDNMDIPTMRDAVAIVAGRALLEASGGVNLENVRAIAEAGLDLISIGRLTHSAPALDISLDFAL